MGHYAECVAGFFGYWWGSGFFFNNNQVNSGASTNQNLAVWAQVTITKEGVTQGTWDLTNQNQKFALGTDPASGGRINGLVSDYTHQFGYNDPTFGTNTNTDYVFSGGKYCLSAAYAPMPCDDPNNAPTFGPISNNLGADQAAYAVLFPELNLELSKLFLLSSLDGYAMHVDLRMGCTLKDGDITTPSGTCTGRDLNNGYEQLFMGSTTGTTYVNTPEPSSIFLIGLGLLGMGWSIHRSRGTGRLTA